jgi:hypothetical protein
MKDIAFEGYVPVLGFQAGCLKILALHGTIQGRLVDLRTTIHEVELYFNCKVHNFFPLEHLPQFVQGHRVS